MSTFTRYYNLYYTTFTILNWQPIFKDKNNIETVLDSFDFLTKNNRIIIYAFVIMIDHIHVIYQILEPYNDAKIKHSFTSFTSKIILTNLNEIVKPKFLVEKSNRKYQTWKSPSLSVELATQKFFNQKFNYLHDNPRRAGMVTDNSDYFYSSYNSYLNDNSDFSFLTLW